MLELDNRAFIAITPPQEVVDRVRDLKRKLKKQERNFNFVNLDQLHITIQFLGNHVSAESLVVLDEQFRKTMHNEKKFQLKLTNLKFGFKSQARPRVLFWDIDQTPELNNFTRSVHDQIKAANVGDVKRKKDYAKMIYHMTLARTKRGISKSFTKQIRKRLDELKLPSMTFEVNEIHLFKSQFSKNDVKHITLASYTLRS